MKPKLMIYNAGGTGANLAQRILNIPSVPGLPPTELIIADTSDSNIYANHEDVNVYLVEGMHGGGKDRKAVHEKTRDNIVAGILKKYEPGTFNIVTCSITGATGSTIGPELAVEILKRNLPVVILLVGSKASGTEVENGFDCLLDLYRYSRANLPIIYRYYQNNETHADGKYDTESPVSIFRAPKSEVDRQIAADIGSIAMLISEQHPGLDRRDIYKFFRFDASTEVPSGMAELRIYNDLAKSEELVDNAIGSASLLTSHDSQTPALNQLYRATGDYSPEILKSDFEVNDLHFVISKANTNHILGEYKDAREHFRKVAAKLTADDDDPFADASGGGFL